MRDKKNPSWREAQLGSEDDNQQLTAVPIVARLDRAIPAFIHGKR
jgi:hypothetical protein